MRVPASHHQVPGHGRDEGHLISTAQISSWKLAIHRPLRCLDPAFMLAADLKEKTVLDHMILTVSNVETSLAFYEAALKPLNIKFFLPYKGEGDHPDLWGLVMARRRSSGSNKGSLSQRQFTGGSRPRTMVKSMNSTGQQCPLVPGTIFHRGHEWNTIPDTTPLMYSTQTDIHSRSSINANDGTAQTYRQFYRQLAFPADDVRG